jgi:peptidoglycan/LPS O-acetylase OafA/YrhL
MTTVTEKASTATGTDQFFPGLEGLRGLAVVAVLFFHGGFSWAKGGFLGVSVFFTLSGFLITTNVLKHSASPGGLSLRDFWNRRFRRLLPASLAAIGLALIYTAVAGDPTQRQTFGGDSVSALTYVANWHFIFSGQSYAALFTAPSALLHFWSLAIEEQFYLVFPLLSLLVLVKLKQGRKTFGLVLGALLTMSVACTLMLGLSDNTIYLSTETRAGEILIGALFAVFMTSHRTQKLSKDKGNLGAIVAVIGIIGLLAATAATITVGEDTSWLYTGGLTAFGLVSLALIASAITPVGPVRTILASRPLRSLGLISYGIYLYHWPIFLWLSPDNTGLSNTALFIPRIAISIALATLSYRFLETPIKTGKPILGLPKRTTALTTMATLATLAILTSITAPKSTLDFTARDKEFAQLNAQAELTVAPGTPRIAQFGDSTAIALGYGVANAFRESKLALPVLGRPKSGCGLLKDVTIMHANHVAKSTGPDCDWPDVWAKFLDTTRIDIATIMFGPWDARPVQFSGSSEWLTPGDAKYDSRFESDFLEASDLLASHGVAVVWLTALPIGDATSQARDFWEGYQHPEWQRHLNDLMVKAAAKRPTTVRVVDLAKWYDSMPRNDIANRPDGAHFEEATATQIAKEWLNKAILNAYQSLRKTPGTSRSTPSTLGN